MILEKSNIKLNLDDTYQECFLSSLINGTINVYQKYQINKDNFIEVFEAYTNDNYHNSLTYELDKNETIESFKNSKECVNGIWLLIDYSQDLGNIIEVTSNPTWFGISKEFNITKLEQLQFATFHYKQDNTLEKIKNDDNYNENNQIDDISDDYDDDSSYNPASDNNLSGHEDDNFSSDVVDSDDKSDSKQPIVLNKQKKILLPRRKTSETLIPTISEQLKTIDFNRIRTSLSSVNNKCNGTYAGDSKDCTYKPIVFILNKPFCLRCAKIKLRLNRSDTIETILTYPNTIKL